jgi:inosine triphosphate pyrophosphatase
LHDPFAELGNDGLWGILRGFEDKSAVAVCNVGFALGEDDDPVVFSGQTYGQIVEPDPDETDVFGWDGVFKPQGFDRKFSQMSVVEKNEISHRSLAMRALQQWVQQNQADIMQKLSSRSS